jgi:hypothetical protein
VLCLRLLPFHCLHFLKCAVPFESKSEVAHFRYRGYFFHLPSNSTIFARLVNDPLKSDAASNRKRKLVGDRKK